MLQQLIAIIIITFFLLRLFKQRGKKEINGSEFLLWLIFWLLALVAIIFIKQIDTLLALLGFSGAAINFLVYLVFRLRLKIAKMDKNISKLNEALSLKK